MKITNQNNLWTNIVPRDCHSVHASKMIQGGRRSIFVGVLAQVPPPIRKTMFLTAKKLFVLLFGLIHLLQVLLGEVFCPDKLVGIVMTDERVICRIFGRITCEISIWHACKVYWFEHTPDHTAKFCVSDVGCFCHLSHFKVIKDRPEALP